ncbi:MULTISPECIES: hypothetical protein [Photorhabdus]|uniref:Photorhabdus luminescens subsp. laumondii TTO1 complete genome segment 8/17 n=2 Tax=Photorhabdus TaxID=29487 RepID=Q7N4V2_PHOLL|nr:MULTISPECIES: hypothetical protein [Photorhabdus]MCC8376586.1 hypothetical protein [Photorhabdus bodei]MCK3670505.1 hypothetical protein [Photorhabdus noenieputensis]MCT8352391.1 hypothetical protein [Photorhabdus kayaii]MDB6368805.1 hypothetical protein [Photorhabdus bodei]NDL10419.1 hypothetical protein [Photorhabdus kayaii]
MATLEQILEDLNELDFIQAQDNVEVMRNEEGCFVHVRMIAYDDLV